MPKMNKRESSEKDRLRKREKRRVKAYTFDERTMFKREPSLQEIKDALRSVRESSWAIFRLAALMDHLAAYQSPTVIMDEDCPGGIRKFFARDGYLVSRYHTLMRYKRLASAIRKMCELPHDFDLLWGFSPELPDDDGGPMWWWEEEYKRLRNFYDSCEGMSFKEIYERVKD